MRISLFEAAGISASSIWATFAATSLAIVFAAQPLAQSTAALAGATSARSAQELDTLVGAIALYPDDLVAIVLPAATNPLQLVHADRFLDKRKTDPKLPVDERWDDAVKSLLNYPDIVKMMSRDLEWTTALGEAVVENQGAVLDAIQSFNTGNINTGNIDVNRGQASTLPANASTWKSARQPGQVSGTASSTARVGDARTGKNSAQIGVKMMTFDPSAGWNEVTQ